MKSILIVDDHFIVRSGLALIIKSKWNDAHIDEAADGDIALKHINNTTYDLITLDINIPGNDFTNLIHNILKIKKDQNILVFSMNQEKIFARRVLKLGTKGFLSKDSPREEILKAVELALNGQKYMSQMFIDQLADDMSHNLTENPFDNLSNRELEVTMQLLTGDDMQKISHTLSIHISTVSTFKRRIFDKLNIANVHELQKLAEAYGIAHA